MLSKFNLDSSGATSAVFTIESDTTGTLTLTATPRTGTAITSNVSVIAGVTKTVTLSGLNPQTTYTVKGQVKSSSGAQSVVKSVTVTTTNAFTANVTGVTDSSATVKINAYSDGELTITHKNVASGVSKTIITNSIMSAGQTKTIEVTGLVPGTQYEITAEFRCDGAGEEPVSVTETITTEQAVDNLAISKILVSDANGDECRAIPVGTDASVTILATTSVKVNVSAVTGATVNIDGKIVENGKYSEAIAVTSGEAKVIPIVVTYNGQTRTYQLTVNVG